MGKIWNYPGQGVLRETAGGILLCDHCPCDPEEESSSSSSSSGSSSGFSGSTFDGCNCCGDEGAPYNVLLSISGVNLDDCDCDGTEIVSSKSWLLPNTDDTDNCDWGLTFPSGECKYRRVGVSYTQIGDTCRISATVWMQPGSSQINWAKFSKTWDAEDFPGCTSVLELDPDPQTIYACADWQDATCIISPQ